MADMTKLVQGIQDLIRDHMSEFAEYPQGMDGLASTENNEGMLVLTFEDGKVIRGIFTQVWEPTIVIDNTPPPIQVPIDAEEQPPQLEIEEQ